jgi:hypothetical protein
MEMSNKKICEEFSKGNFELIYNYLAEDIRLNIIGDKILKGKQTVTEFCNHTAAHFSELATDFRINNVIADNNCVAIDGTAHFINKDNKSTYISSCDVYRFQDEKLQEITSYCIITHKDQ